MQLTKVLAGGVVTHPVTKYRREIDGLRALAVIPVILFHAGFGLFAGGYVGVDVFFVISGYLITTIIHTEIGDGRFSIVQFYERRVRRIMPALLLVLIVSTVFAVLWMLPFRFEAYSKRLIAVSVFASNFAFWLEGGYFDQSNLLKPLLHTWSLAVEEQFYLIFPAFLLLAAKWRGRATLVVVAALTVASLGLSEWASSRYVGANFYLLPTRFWELGIGALIALAGLDRHRFRWSRPISELGSAAGLAMILFAVFVYTESTPFPGFYALAPVVGAALIICFATPNTATGRLLSLRPVVLIGLISYSAYLWHYPVFAFARIRSFDKISTTGFLLLTLLTLGLAYASWKWVEAPFRDRQRYTRRQVFAWSAALSCVLIAVGALGVLTKGLPQRLDPAVVSMAGMRESASWWGYQCTPDGDPPAAEHCRRGQFPRQVVLWGDSQAMALAPGLEEVMAEQGASLVSLAHVDCTPVMGWNIKAPGCEDFRQRSMAYLTENSDQHQTVIIHGRWLNLLGPTGPALAFDDGDGTELKFSPWVPSLAGFSGRNPQDPDYIDHVHGLVSATFRQLLDSGHKVVLVYDVPEMGWDVPIYRAKSMLFNSDKPDLTSNYQAVTAFQSNGTEFLDALGEHPNLLRVYPNRALCDRQVPGRCVGELENGPLFLDTHHLSEAGAMLVAREVQKAMSTRGW
jgi:peptidoglycan/LPS O-acetylase OafA/YrhL